MEEVIVFTDLDMEQFRTRLIQARQHAGLSQNQVAWGAELSQSHISSIEGGKAQKVQIQTLYKLCQALGVSADYLLGLTK